MFLCVHDALGHEQGMQVLFFCESVVQNAARQMHSIA